MGDRVMRRITLSDLDSIDLTKVYIARNHSQYSTLDYMMVDDMGNYVLAPLGSPSMYILGLDTERTAKERIETAIRVLNLEVYEYEDMTEYIRRMSRYINANNMALGCK